MTSTIPPMTPMQNTLIQFIRNELLNNRPDIKLETSDDLLGGGLVDSMGMLRLISHIEKQFDVKVPAEDITIENFMTIEVIVAYLERRKAVV